MGLADQNKRVHIGGGGEEERKIVLFYKRLQGYPYILSTEIRWEKQNTSREVNKKLRFLRVCSCKSRQMFI